MFETIDPENNDDVDINEWKKGNQSKMCKNAILCVKK